MADERRKTQVTVVDDFSTHQFRYEEDFQNRPMALRGQTYNLEARTIAALGRKVESGASQREGKLVHTPSGDVRVQTTQGAPAGSEALVGGFRDGRQMEAKGGTSDQPRGDKETDNTESEPARAKRKG